MTHITVTHTHGQEDNIVRYFSSVEENVVKGDDDEAKAACNGKSTCYKKTQNGSFVGITNKWMKSYLEGGGMVPT